MKRTYEWLTIDGARVFRVTDLQEKLTMEFPRESVEPRVMRNLPYGAEDSTEAYIGKVAADASGSMKAVEKRLLGGPDATATEKLLAEYIARFGPLNG